ncbi:MAG: hypothetical protein JSV35_06485 [Candidatus Bathyarchaeota archaeon]|nr:MAG: hypothetical protein JSV35_06485 [Candidatus Bathyarchaeota archaeon]
MMYHDVSENIPDEHWRAGDVLYLTPARIVYHDLECVDFSNSTTDGFAWGHRFTIDWESISQE